MASGPGFFGRNYPLPSPPRFPFLLFPSVWLPDEVRSDKSLNGPLFIEKNLENNSNPISCSMLQSCPECNVYSNPGSNIVDKSHTTLESDFTQSKRGSRGTPRSSLAQSYCTMYGTPRKSWFRDSGFHYLDCDLKNGWSFQISNPPPPPPPPQLKKKNVFNSGFCC